MHLLSFQAAIPISMVTSKRLTGARYSVSQYTGATVVAAGIVIAIGPSLAVGSNRYKSEDKMALLKRLLLWCREAGGQQSFAAVPPPHGRGLGLDMWCASRGSFVHLVITQKIFSDNTLGVIFQVPATE